MLWVSPVPAVETFCGINQAVHFSAEDLRHCQCGPERAMMNSEAGPFVSRRAHCREGARLGLSMSIGVSAAASGRGCQRDLLRAPRSTQDCVCTGAPPRKALRWLGLPQGMTARLFELDVVSTSTAAVHPAACKRTFHEFLRTSVGADFHPFDPQAGYQVSVDGMPRGDGVRDFLVPRAVPVPEGRPDIGPEELTTHGAGIGKNQELTQRIYLDGVEVFPGSVRRRQAAKRPALRRVVVSSANTALVLRSAGLGRVGGQVDRVTLAHWHLLRKPQPDSFVAGVVLAGVSPKQAAVSQDALIGFGYVVRVDRVGQWVGVRAHGAGAVVTDLADLLASCR
jgi:beta-phosphoglucomutase-like phosphatase (HAD superfamily)